MEGPRKGRAPFPPPIRMVIPIWRDSICGKVAMALLIGLALLTPGLQDLERRHFGASDQFDWRIRARLLDRFDGDFMVG